MGELIDLTNAVHDLADGRGALHQVTEAAQSFMETAGPDEVALILFSFLAYFAEQGDEVREARIEAAIQEIQASGSGS